MATFRDFPPRLMQAVAAAHYLGVSTTKFRTLNITSRRMGGNVLWDRSDLDQYADNLPYEEINDQGGDECKAADNAWGIVKAN